MAIGRLLLERGYGVSFVLLAAPEELSRDAKTNYDLVCALDGNIQVVLSAAKLKKILEDYATWRGRFWSMPYSAPDWINPSRPDSLPKHSTLSMPPAFRSPPWIFLRDWLRGSLPRPAFIYGPG